MTIPFEKLSSDENAQVRMPDVQVNVQVNAQVDRTEEMSVAEKIMSFCAEPKSLLEIAGYLGYKDRRSVRRILNPLLEQGRIAMTVPEKPNSRLQKYITIK